MVCPAIPSAFPAAIGGNRCTFPPVAGVTVSCEKAYNHFIGEAHQTCAVTSPDLAITCGDAGSSTVIGPGGSSSTEGCFGSIGTTPVSVGCARAAHSDASTRFDSVTCGAGPVSYGETMTTTNFPAPQEVDTQTITVGTLHLTYRCVNNVCGVVTS
jgi:hypothetical protein